MIVLLLLTLQTVDGFGPSGVQAEVQAAGGLDGAGGLGLCNNVRGLVLFASSGGFVDTTSSCLSSDTL